MIAARPSESYWFVFTPISCLGKRPQRIFNHNPANTYQGSVAKNRLIAERTLKIFSEAIHERFQMASFSGRNYSLGCPLVLPLWDQLPGY
jgi:hypothetical protein